MCGNTEYLIYYVYDENGLPIGLKYRTSAYEAGVFDCFFFEKNLQGDIIGVYNSTGKRIGTYTYDAWGNFNYSLASGNTALETRIVFRLNPFRYRGYYYDVETGLYYLQSRYYNPEWGRFLNADGYVSTGAGMLGYNMFVYANNNPVMFTDPTGNWPSLSQILTGIAVVAGVVAVAAICVATAGVGALAIAGTTAGVAATVAAADTVIVTAGVVMVASYAAAGIAAIAEDRESATSKEIAVSETNQKQQAFFPENPYSFSPKGLRLEERPGTKNGKILQWVDPVSEYPVFEWDEDLRNGPHYHTMLPGWKGKHSGPHYKAGEAVPEPWNTIYFGG